MKKCEIIVIADRSGSMAAIQDDAIGGFNTFLKEQKKVDGEAVMTYVQFDSKYEPVFKRKPLQEVEPLTRETFSPRGMTALHDAIGRTVKNGDGGHICKECGQHDEKKIVVIITDGQENSSTEWNLKTVNELITKKREAGWEFLFLAANQDAMVEGVKMGVAAANTQSYVFTGDGVRSVYSTSADVVTRIRTGDTPGNHSSTSGKD